MPTSIPRNFMPAMFRPRGIIQAGRTDLTRLRSAKIQTISPRWPAFRQPRVDNQRKDKRVESYLVRCLDGGSSPPISTENASQIPWEVFFQIVPHFVPHFLGRFRTRTWVNLYGVEWRGKRKFLSQFVTSNGKINIIFSHCLSYRCLPDLTASDNTLFDPDSKECSL